LISGERGRPGTEGRLLGTAPIGRQEPLLVRRSEGQLQAYDRSRRCLAEAASSSVTLSG
jgi:hypothetical protein